MKAIKFTVNLKIEVLSMDSVVNLLNQAAQQIEHESREGSLVFEDGDSVGWSTESLPIVF